MTRGLTFETPPHGGALRSSAPAMADIPRNGWRSRPEGNRRLRTSTEPSSGDHFNALEFIQIIDPDLERRRLLTGDDGLVLNPVEGQPNKEILFGSDFLQLILRIDTYPLLDVEQFHIYIPSLRCKRFRTWQTGVTAGRVS